MEWENKHRHVCLNALVIQIGLFSRNALAGGSARSIALNSNSRTFFDWKRPSGEKGREKIFREISYIFYFIRILGNPHLSLSLLFFLLLFLPLSLLILSFLSFSGPVCVLKDHCPFPSRPRYIHISNTLHFTATARHTQECT